MWFMLCQASPIMMTSSNGNISALLAICARNSMVTGEFPTQRPVTRNFDVFFDLCLNIRLNKQSLCWWFETQLRSLWRHCNDACILHRMIKDNLSPGWEDVVSPCQNWSQFEVFSGQYSKPSWLFTCTCAMIDLCEWSTVQCCSIHHFRHSFD